MKKNYHFLCIFDVRKDDFVTNVGIKEPILHKLIKVVVGGRQRDKLVLFIYLHNFYPAFHTEGTQSKNKSVFR